MSFKKSFLIASLHILVLTSSAQISEEALAKMLNSPPDDQYIGTVTVGILQGGGSLIGADFEFLVEDHYGFQIGGGFVGYGAALNYHFKGGIRSSFLSFGYWHQGHQETYVQSLIGPTFVYRGPRWFTAQIGLGYQLEEGPAAQQLELDLPGTQLLYSIGAYFPLH